MNVVAWVALAASCFMTQQPARLCLASPQASSAPVVVAGPKWTGKAVDVVLSAEAALVWDWDTQQIIYQKQAYTRRPVASLSKLLSALAVRSVLKPDAIVTIPSEVRVVQRQGADIALPVGGRTTVRGLFSAGLIASANDAMVALATAARGSEAEFVGFANEYAARLGLSDTRVANATGLSGGEQYSTAADVRRLLTLTYQDSLLGPFLAEQRGVLTLSGGLKPRSYVSTNKLLGTYLPVLAAKTGYTTEAGENLAIITGRDGHKLGAVILGSRDRFTDMKVLVEWVWRNYTWE